VSWRRHLELAHHPLAGTESYNERIGESALERIGVKKWRKRVLDALATLEGLVNFDHCFIGGGNARLLKDCLPAGYEIVDNVNGILGGIKCGKPSTERSSEAQLAFKLAEHSSLSEYLSAPSPTELVCESVVASACQLRSWLAASAAG